MNFALIGCCPEPTVVQLHLQENTGKSQMFHEVSMKDSVSSSVHPVELWIPFNPERSKSAIQGI
jgi:hypothetical protein